MSKESIVLSLRELIDTAFGDYDKNTVNFNLVKTIMYILARQLRLLERQVEVESNKSLIEQSVDKKSSNLSVTEVKIQAKVPQKKGKKTSTGSKTGDRKDSKADDDDKYSNETPIKKIKGETAADMSQEKTGLPATKEKSKRPSQTKVESDTESDEIAKRERLIRVINQRLDSRDEGREISTPMTTPVASEKILVVKTKNQQERDKKERTAPKISVVTQEQFDALVKEVDTLRKKLKPSMSLDIPETKDLMKQLKKGASLSESIVALQLSARLEAAERTLERMINLVTYLAQHADADKNIEMEEKDIPSEKSEEKLEASEKRQLTDTSKSVVDRVAYPELREILQELKITIEKDVESMVSKNKAAAENALKLCTNLDKKLSKALLVEMRMGQIEHMVDEYTQKINILDTSLSSQMTHYQELLTQMEHDLEAGIENMAEALANAGGDTTAISELNAHFSSLALDFDNMAVAQRELRDNQRIFSVDVADLWHQVEYLKEAKADREEVEDALRDKAGLDLLNGLTTMMQFEAVSGDLEKRIGAAYEKFNSQEFMWQKAIDDLIRELNERAHIIQLESLRDEINKNLNSIKDRLEFIANILGEPRAAGTTRVLHRNTACVSCSLPAHMAEEVPEVPLLPAVRDRRKTPAIANEADGAGDFKPCIPGEPIPDRILHDIRAKSCTRFCGGEHTKVAFRPPQPEKAVNVSHIPQGTSLEMLNANNKTLKFNEALVPCLPCNYYPDEQIKQPCTCAEICQCYLSTEAFD